MSNEGGESEIIKGKYFGKDEKRADGGQNRLDVVLDVLSTHRRRYALYYLRRTELTDIDELARHVTAAISDRPEDEITDDRIEKTKVGLIHSDFPRLREVGVIEYDHRNGTVRYRQPSRLVPILLRVCSELEPAPTYSD